MPNVSTIIDDFSGDTVNTDLWAENYNTAGDPPTQTGGRARVPCTAGYAAFSTLPAYTLAGGHLGCRLYPAPLDGATAECWSQVLIQTTTPGTDVTIEYDAVADMLAMSVRVGYTDPDYTAIPYDPVAHAYVRIREDAGTLTWETAPDGVTWTVQRAATSPAWVTAPDLQVQLIAHRGDGLDNFAEYDTVNLPPGTALLRAAADPTTGRPLAAVKTRSVAAARSTDGAGAVGAAKTTTLRPADSTDTARPLVAGHRIRLGVASDASAGRPITAGHQVTVGAAQDTSDAGQYGHARSALLTPGTNLDAGLPLTATKATSTRAADSWEAARPLVIGKTLRLGHARSDEAAGPYVGVGETRLRTVHTVDHGHVLTSSKTADLTAAGGDDTARPLAGAKAQPLQAAATTQRAMPLFPGKTQVLPAVASRARAGALEGAKRIALGTAREAAGATRFAGRSAGPVTAARAQDTARPLAGAKRLVLGAARCTEALRPVTAGHRTRLGLARTVERVSGAAVGKARALASAGGAERGMRLTGRSHTQLDPARTTDRAGRIRQPFQIRRWHTARQIDRAAPITWKKQQPADQLTSSVGGPSLTASVSGPSLTASTTSGGG